MLKSLAGAGAGLGGKWGLGGLGRNKYWPSDALGTGLGGFRKRIDAPCGVVACDAVHSLPPPPGAAALPQTGPTPAGALGSAARGLRPAPPLRGATRYYRCASIYAQMSIPFFCPDKILDLPACPRSHRQSPSD
jgi:hypothetical protein